MSLEAFMDSPSHGFKRKSSTINDDLKENPKGVNLVDYSQLVLSTMMATYKPGEQLDVNMMRHLILNTLRSNVLKNKKQYPLTILCVDNGQGGYWRKQQAWYYKHSRSKQREDSGYDFKTIFEGMEIIKKEIIENLPYVVLDVKGMEADDHIAIMSMKFAKQGVPILITSSDGDFTQLHDLPNIKQWSPIQKKWVKPKNGSAKNDLKFKCFKGDKKDGIASINAESDHYAQDEIKRAPAIRSSELEKWMNTKEEDLPFILSTKQYERYLENKKLLDLRMIPDTMKEKSIEAFTDHKLAPRKNIYPYFVKSGLVKLMDAVSEF